MSVTELLPYRAINIKSTLVQVMAWYRTVNQPFLTEDDPVHWHIHSSPDLNELKEYFDLLIGWIASASFAFYPFASILLTIV